MKAVTLHQPWATCLVRGVKVFETRSWDTDHRGALAVHAGKRITDEGLEVFSRLLDASAAFRALRFGTLSAMPMGAVLGLVNLDETHHTAFITGHTAGQAMFRRFTEDPELEKLLGNFSDDRFAWRCSAPCVFAKPIPARGYQRLWNWDGSAAA